MATDATTPSVNGLYANQYGQPAELAANTPSAPSHAPSASQSGSATGATQKADPQEIGWYFVEQYYTTLSKSPERIHLFYSKKSQLVTGVEAEKVIPAVGTKAISEKIKALDIQDCKVRVLNVDSQSSFQNIVVQVIGEMSIKSQPHHKFVQTFVLAEQPNGYFVLNDIFRYLNDDEDEIVDDDAAQEEFPQEEHPTPLEPTSETLALEDEVVTEAAAKEVDEKLEEEEEIVEDVAETAVNGDEVEPSIDEATEDQDTSTGAKDVAESEATEDTPAEESVQTESTTATSAKAAGSTQPDAPPAKKTWASMVGGKAPAVPALPVNPPATTQTKALRPTQQTQAPKAAAEPVPTATSPSVTQSQTQSNGWQTADGGKKAKGPQAKATPEGVTLAYIKNVTEKIDAQALRDVLEKFGEIKYFDVSRPRNCAFVEFANTTGYNAAVAANPHTVGTEQIYVEERRPRPNAYGGNNAAFGRGNGNAGRGRGNVQGRAGSQNTFPKDAGRGNFQQRGGKSGNVTPKGRGQAPAS